MTEIDLMDATDSLAAYARDSRHGAVILTDDGKPVAAVISLEGVDRETVSLSQNPKFLAILDRARARRKSEGGISSAEIRREFGIKAPKARRKTR